MLKWILFRYIALISHYDKQMNINKVGYRYARRNGKNYMKSSFTLLHMVNIVIYFRHYQNMLQKKNYSTKLTKVGEQIATITKQMDLNSIIDIDLVSFGLLKYTIFEK